MIIPLLCIDMEISHLHHDVCDDGYPNLLQVVDPVRRGMQLAQSNKPI